MHLLLLLVLFVCCCCVERHACPGGPPSALTAAASLPALVHAAGASDKGKAAVGSLAASSPATLAVLQHSKVINAASFSPVTGGRERGSAACLPALRARHVPPRGSSRWAAAQRRRPARPPPQAARS